jgi:hypothetical protein
MRHRKQELCGAPLFDAPHKLEILWSILTYTPHKYFCEAHIFRCATEYICIYNNFLNSACYNNNSGGRSKADFWLSGATHPRKQNKIILILKSFLKIESSCK